MPEWNENVFYFWHRELLCESCGYKEEVLVLTGRRQGCEMEECQRIVVVDDAHCCERAAQS